MYKQYTIHTVSTYTDTGFLGEVQFKKEDFSTKIGVLFKSNVQKNWTF